MKFLLTTLLFVSCTQADEQKNYVTYLGSDPKVVGEKSQTVIKLRFKVMDGFHVQTNPASPKQIPTTLNLGSTKGLQFGTPKYPEGKKFRLKGGSREISVYEGTFEVEVPVTVAADKKSALSVDSSLRYQACDYTKCFFPQTLKMNVDL